VFKNAFAADIVWNKTWLNFASKIVDCVFLVHSKSLGNVVGIVELSLNKANSKQSQQKKE